jgi:putative membrane protein
LKKLLHDGVARRPFAGRLLLLMAAELALPAMSPLLATPAPTPAPLSASAAQNLDALNAEGREFLKLVAWDDLLQIEAARLAASKAANPQVQAFADALLRSRSRIQDSLVQLAARRATELPTAIRDSDALHLLAELRGASGIQFDLAYSRAMLDAHRSAVRRFEQAARSDTQDAEVRSFAAAQLPLLRDYLRMAQTLPGSHQG